MKVLHLINKRGEGDLYPKGMSSVAGEPGVFMSCCWDIKLEDAIKLIGGKIYFHETKSKPSKLGGNVIDVAEIDMSDGATEYYIPSEGDKDKKPARVMFKFQLTQDCRDVKWAGKSHSMSWTSGIIDV